jgi:heptosyltransferase-2
VREDEKIGDYTISPDCIYFKGDAPCIYHKKLRKQCRCDKFAPRGAKYLIVKLGAAGDVIRTTPILRYIIEKDPHAEITWVTEFPDFIPSLVKRVINAKDSLSLMAMLAEEFDYAYNLDKDYAACGLMNQVKAKVKKGYYLRDGICYPLDSDANDKYITGIDDLHYQQNSLSYIEETFLIIGAGKQVREYFLDEPSEENVVHIPNDLKRPLIGLNTGCGGRWITRLYPREKWQMLARLALDKDYGVVLLGGPDEDQRNKEIAGNVQGTYYPGTHSLKGFMSLISQIDLLVTSITMAFHVAVGYRKKTVVLNNCFNKNEFELYGRGEIIEPEVDCLACFRGICDKP